MPERPWIKASQFSRVPIPRGDTIPSPVMTTLRPMRRSFPRPSGVRLDVADSVADRMDLLGVFVADLDLERLLEGHDQLDGVKRISPEIVDERGFHRHLFGVDPELLDDDSLDLVLDALRHLCSSPADPGRGRPPSG